MATFTPSWNFIGTSLFTAQGVNQALAQAGLDFKVAKSPLEATTPSRIVPNMVATFRTDNGNVLGVVGEGYGIVNNEDAFSFADLINDLTWTRGGYTETGLAFLVGQLPEVTIKGEAFIPHIIFQNSFNGRWNLKGQVILEDKARGLAISMPGKTDIIIRHSKRAEDRVRLAQSALSTIQRYINDFEMEVDGMAGVKIDIAALEVVVSDLFPIKTGDTDRIRDNQLKRREEFLESYNSKENSSWWGTGWGIIKAFADFQAKVATKTSQKSARKAEVVFENTLIGGKNYQHLMKVLENL